jgi:hypothetical protein
MSSELLSCLLALLTDRQRATSKVGRPVAWIELTVCLQETCAIHSRHVAFVEAVQVLQPSSLLLLASSSSFVMQPGPSPRVALLIVSAIPELGDRPSAAAAPMPSVSDDNIKSQWWNSDEGGTALAFQRKENQQCEPHCLQLRRLCHRIQPARRHRLFSLTTTTFTPFLRQRR